MKNVLKLSLVTLSLLGAGTSVAQVPLKATLYQDANCGCCQDYATYLKKNNINVQSINQTDMAKIKRQFGSLKLASCHTMRIGNYTVEGHVPIAAINKLLAQRPNIIGISVPGMPMNSPGMGPVRKGTLKVMAILKNGHSQQFSME